LAIGKAAEEPALRVGVFGAAGKMGRAVCRAVEGDPALDLVAAVDPAAAGEKLDGSGIVISEQPEALLEAGAEVAVDFTVAAAAVANASWCASNGVHAVIGTTGIGEEDLGRLRSLFEASKANCVLAPNFAIGAVLMMRFAEAAARWFESVEVVEMHHDAKLDAPSGTALLAARRVSAARERASGGPSPRAGADLPSRGLEASPGVRVHSVRLKGLVAHHEVLFGSPGEVLTIRHDSLDRSSFMPGVLLAIKQVPLRRGFTLGLDPFLGIA
jgi:4-hydroxy-tetrahydrodipicolinate reductase